MNYIDNASHLFNQNKDLLSLHQLTRTIQHGSYQARTSFSDFWKAPFPI